MAFEVLDAIKKRRSIRKFLDNPVEWDKVVNILEAGRFAPSSGNLQNWKFIVVTEKARKKQIAEACLNQAWIATAPVIIAIVSKPEKTLQYYGEPGRKYTIQNCACAAMNMLLEAYEEGLGACWIGGFDESMLNIALGLPDRAKPEVIIPIGYPDEEVPMPPREVLESQVHLNRYNNRIKNFNLVLWDFSLMTEDFVKSIKDTAIKKSQKWKEKIERIAEEGEEPEEELTKEEYDRLKAKGKERRKKEIHGKIKGIHEKIKKKLKERKKKKEMELLKEY
jgi:nitroreductase